MNAPALPARAESRFWRLAALAALLIGAGTDEASTLPAGVSLWEHARSQAQVHRFSTLFTAQDVQGRLNTETGLAAAVDWCRKTAVTKVYVESFRDGYQADRDTLLRVRDRFAREGFLVSGCVTPTRVGKSSTGWKDTISCYTDPATQERVKGIFEFTARLFDEIMIDDFWFTDCACPDCDKARLARTVTVAGKPHPVSGDTWEDYRCELMVRLSREHVLAASKRANPGCKLIVKYPQWYDRFHERGYEVTRQTADFDRTWVGTETRDYEDPRWGGTVQYEAYFIMRWLGGLGGAKCGGGWYDWLGTTERTYIEQARQTVLGGARESMLFCYGGLQGSTGPRNVEALRAEIPELFEVAREVAQRRPVGIAAYKPTNSHSEKEARVFDFVGMLGLPLVPCHEFPTNAPAAFFSMHALKDADFVPKLERFVAAGRPVLLTDGLTTRLANRISARPPQVQVLPVKGDPKSLLQLDRAALDALRAPLLAPFKANFSAPNRVALYLFEDGSYVVANFNRASCEAILNGQKLKVDGWVYSWK